MPDLSHDDDAKTHLLETVRRIAVVGASADSSRDSNRIFRYLRSHDYDALPVTPKPDEVAGVEPVPDLDAAKAHWDDSIDIVDVFRRPDAAGEVVDAAIAAGAKAVWFQLGTDHPDAVAKALAAGLDVVADQCIYLEHKRLIA
jgi:uncharacterized protein